MVESESEVQQVDTEIAPDEMVPKSRVNEIVKREKGLAADKVRREMEALHAQELERLQASQQPMGSNSEAQQPDMRSQVQQLLSEEIQKYQAEEERKEQEARQAELKAEIDKSANQYLIRVDEGKKDFADFDEVMRDFDLRAFSGIALLAGQMDNTAAIMYELAQNPLKVSQLHVLAQQSPEMAKKEMQKLAGSITKNQQAVSDNVQTNAPLSRLKSSSVAGADNGQMSLKDMKKADWLRG